MSVTLGILGASPNITITVPSDKGRDPIYTMHSARRRYSSYGAERVTLIPRRDGEGWQKKKEEGTRDGPISNS